MKYVKKFLATLAGFIIAHYIIKEIEKHNSNQEEKIS